MQQVDASLFVWVPAVSALGGALIGAAAVLIGQLISTKGKKRELFFNARAEAYGEMLAAAAAYTLDTTEENYQRWLTAYGKALLFASDEVTKALIEKQAGLNIAVVKLRAATTDSDRDKVRVTVYHNAVNRIIDAMRKDFLES